MTANQMIIRIAAITLSVFCVAGTANSQERPKPPPGCKISSVKLEPYTNYIGRAAVDNTSDASDLYVTACNQAVDELDRRCQDSCKNYKKRGTSNACAANPVDATIDEFDEKVHIINLGKDKLTEKLYFTVKCTASAVCTCDP